MKRLIWVIDDSPTVRKIFETCLPPEGFEVKSFRDGMEALTHLNTQPDGRLPDLVIVDIVLPKMDGYDVLQRLRAKAVLSETVFVAISRRDGVLDRLMARLAGAVAYINKPFTLADVFTVLRQQLHIQEEAGRGGPLHGGDAQPSAREKREGRPHDGGNGHNGP